MPVIRRARVDNNQKQIVEALRSLGFSVQHLHTIGRGCPDILAGKDGKNFLIEIKNGKGQLNPDQQQWHQNWKGQVTTIHNESELLFL